MDKELCRKLLLSYICLFSVNDIDLIKKNHDLIIKNFGDDNIHGDAFYQCVYSVVSLLKKLQQERDTLHSNEQTTHFTAVFLKTMSDIIDKIKSTIEKYVELDEIFLADGTERFSHKYLTCTNSAVNSKALLMAALQLDPSKGVNQLLTAKDILSVEDENITQEVNLTPLHIAALIGSPTAVATLLNAEADVSQQATVWVKQQGLDTRNILLTSYMSGIRGELKTLTAIDANLVTYPEEKVLALLHNAYRKKGSTKHLTAAIFRQIDKLSFNPTLNAQVLRGIAELIRLGGSLHTRNRTFGEKALSLLTKKLSYFKQTLGLAATKEVTKQAAVIEAIAMLLNLERAGVFNLRRLREVAEHVDFSEIREVVTVEEDVEDESFAAAQFLMATSNESTLVHIAARSLYHMPVLECLITLQPTLINCRLSNGATPLYEALAHGCDANTVAFLLANGANPNASILEAAYCLPSNNPKATPDERQSQQQIQFERLRVLFRLAGPKLKFDLNSQKIILKEAVKRGDWRCIEFMVVQGVNVPTLLNEIMPDLNIRQCTSIETLALLNALHPAMHVPTVKEESEHHARSNPFWDEMSPDRQQDKLKHARFFSFMMAYDRDLFDREENITSYAVEMAHDYMRQFNDDEIDTESIKRYFEDNRDAIIQVLQTKEYATNEAHQNIMLEAITNAALQIFHYQNRVKTLKNLSRLTKYDIAQTHRSNVLIRYAIGFITAPNPDDELNDKGLQPFATMPAEVVVNILSFFNNRELPNLRLVSKSIGRPDSNINSTNPRIINEELNERIAADYYQQLDRVLSQWWKKPEAVTARLQLVPPKFKCPGQTLINQGHNLDRESQCLQM